MTDCVRRLERAGVSEALLSVEWIVRDVLRLSRADLFLSRSMSVDPLKASEIVALVERRAGGEPVQYVVGYTEFFGIRIRVGPSVLIPRPETEELVERCLERIGDGVGVRVLDVGTGSGCIAIAIKKLRPRAEVFALDLSSDALEVARLNARENGVEVGYFLADITNPVESGEIGAPFDLIVFNPPYIPLAERERLQPEVREFEPAAALFADDDGLGVFDRSLSTIYALAADGGDVLFEIHSPTAHRFASRLGAAGFVDIKLERDLSDRDRFLSGKKATSTR